MPCATCLIITPGGHRRQSSPGCAGGRRSLGRCRRASIRSSSPSDHAWKGQPRGVTGDRRPRLRRRGRGQPHRGAQQRRDGSVRGLPGIVGADRAPAATPPRTARSATARPCPGDRPRRARQDRPRSAPRSPGRSGASVRSPSGVSSRSSTSAATCRARDSPIRTEGQPADGEDLVRAQRLVDGPDDGRRRRRRRGSRCVDSRSAARTPRGLVQTCRGSSGNQLRADAKRVQPERLHLHRLADSAA